MSTPGYLPPIRTRDTLPRRVRHTRRLRNWTLLVCLLLVAWTVGGLPVYVRPQIDPLRRADAILVLGGHGDLRYALGLDLGLQGLAPNLVVSNPTGAADQWQADYCATPPAGLHVYCFVPDPPTTKGEGRELHRLAAQHGWRTVITVTFPPHVSRARFVLERSCDGFRV